MENNFKTSFIPKKPIFAEQKIIRNSGGTSIFMLIAVIIFVASIAIAGFAFLSKELLIRNQIGYREDLKEAQTQFDLDLIDKLKKANTKIDLGRQLLANHLAVSEVFGILNGLTSDGVSFSSFDFSGPLMTSVKNDDNRQGDSNPVRITLKGVGRSFSAIAWQSKVFGEANAFGKGKSLNNPILSDLVLDVGGNVAFTFTATLNQNDIIYGKVLEERVAQ